MALLVKSRTAGAAETVSLVLVRPDFLIAGIASECETFTTGKLIFRLVTGTQLMIVAGDNVLDLVLGLLFDIPDGFSASFCTLQDQYTVFS